MLFLQTCYNLKEFATKADQRLLATQIAREGERLVQRLLLHGCEQTMKTTQLDTPSQPMYPSLVVLLFFFPIASVYMTADQKETPGTCSVQGFVSNSTCKPWRFLGGVWSGLGDRSCCRQLRNPGAGTCLLILQGFTCGKSSFLICHSWSCTYVKERVFNCNLSQLSKHLAN